MLKQISRFFIVVVFCLGVLNFAASQDWDVPLIGVKTVEAGGGCVFGYIKCKYGAGWDCFSVHFGEVKCSPCLDC